MKSFIFIVFVLLAGCQSERKLETYKNYIASWSPDSKKILFYSDRNGNWDIFSIHPDGRALRQITHSLFNETEPNWHPQRNAYAFSSDSLGERRIFMHDFDTDSTMMIANAPGQHASPS